MTMREAIQRHGTLWFWTMAFTCFTVIPLGFYFGAPIWPGPEWLFAGLLGLCAVLVAHGVTLTYANTRESH